LILRHRLLLLLDTLLAFESQIQLLLLGAMPLPLLLLLLLMLVPLLLLLLLTLLTLLTLLLQQVAHQPRCCSPRGHQNHLQCSDTCVQDMPQLNFCQWVSAARPVSLQSRTTVQNHGSTQEERVLWTQLC